ncbi:hypothetical protein ACQP2Y_27750 [Actinoplanes sp. CA-051413]|uniref:hypothetical protein n=1 Tax=Actinoplanes sp. CA-051413 TaxID=3239899 RepID=UPI003D967053
MSTTGAVVRGVVGLAAVLAGWWLVDFELVRGWHWRSPMWWIATTVQGYGYLTVFQAVRGFVRSRREVAAVA